jgi:hypothetical protein
LKNTHVSADVTRADDGVQYQVAGWTVLVELLFQGLLKVKQQQDKKVCEKKCISKGSKWLRTSQSNAEEKKVGTRACGRSGESLVVDLSLVIVQLHQLQIPVC